MKKIVTTLTALLATLALAIGFTACKKDEINNTVNEQQWYDALILFSGDAEKVNMSDLVFAYTCKEYDSENSAVKSTEFFEMDYAHKAFHVKGVEGENLITDMYTWQSGEKYYFCEKAGEEPQKMEEFIEDGKVDGMFVDEAFLVYSCANYVGELNTLCNIAERYSDFTLDEQSNTYHAVLTSEEGTFDVTFKFENNKLSKAVILWNDEGNSGNYEMEFTYGNSITIPQDVVDMPITRESK